MRWLAVLVALAGCDRVFGLGDPYQDARAGDGPILDAPGPHADAVVDSPPAMLVPSAHYRFDGDFTDDVTSAMGNCVLSASNPCQFVAGKHGGAVHLDGTNCVRLTVPPQFPAFTLAVWVEMDTSSGGVVIDRPEMMTLPTSDSWLVSVGASTAQFTTHTTAGDDVLGHQTNLPTGIWVHLAVTFDPAEKAIYVSSDPPSTEPNPMVVLYGTATGLYIGCHETATTVTYFTGAIDDLYIFDHALTPQEIATIP